MKRVDKHRLARLLMHPKHNRRQLMLVLYDMTEIVTRDDDERGDILLHLIDILPKAKSTPDAFSFFLVSARRKLLKIRRKEIRWTKLI